MSEQPGRKKFIGRLAACVVGGACMTAVTALLPALTRDDPWRMATEDSREREDVETSAVALTGNDAWARVAVVWIDVPKSDMLVSMRAQEVRSLTGLGGWATLPPVIESNKQCRAIATGVPFKCLTGCGISNDTDPTTFVSTIDLARPTWNAKMRSLPTGVRPVQLAANVGIWSLLIGVVALVPWSGKKKDARTDPGVGGAA